MADKAISELVAASEIIASDLFVLEQGGTAKKLSGQTLTTFLLRLVEAHGGIVSVEKTGTTALVDTYTITFADMSTSTFTVTNGEKGDKGDNSYVWIKYSSVYPTQNSDMYDSPDNYMGIYAGNLSAPPAAYTEYAWFRIKGAKGDTGAAATIVSQSVSYQASTSGTVVPDGVWSPEVPTVPQGQYLWTKTTLQFNVGAALTWYSVSHSGLDGSGAVSAVNGITPDFTGNVILSAENVGAIPEGTGVVGTPELANGSVTSEKVAPGAVGAGNLASNAKALPFTVTLLASGWSNNQQTINNANFITTEFVYIVSPASASFVEYGKSQIYADDVTINGRMVFHCDNVPTVNLTVNIVRMVST